MRWIHILFIHQFYFEFSEDFFDHKRERFRVKTGLLFFIDFSLYTTYSSSVALPLVLSQAVSRGQYNVQTLFAVLCVVLCFELRRWAHLVLLASTLRVLRVVADALGVVVLSLSHSKNDGGVSSARDARFQRWARISKDVPGSGSRSNRR